MTKLETASSAAFLTTLEAAIFLGFSTRHMEQMRERGDGPTFLKLGRRSVRYRRADLESWIEAHAVQTTEEGRAIQKREAK